MEISGSIETRLLSVPTRRTEVASARSENLKLRRLISNRISDYRSELGAATLSNLGALR